VPEVDVEGHVIGEAIVVSQRLQIPGGTGWKPHPRGRDRLAVTATSDALAIKPMGEIAMITIECPWCEASIALERADVMRCEDCRIEVQIDPTTATEVPLAA